MGAVFGVVSTEDCVRDLYYGTDYHSHLGTKIGGMAVLGQDGKINQSIHEIERHPFRAQLEDFFNKTSGKAGIGVISDNEPQPLLIGSRLGNFAIAHVGAVKNLEALTKCAYHELGHFSEVSGGGINPLELVASLIVSGRDFVEGIKEMREKINGSSSLLLLTDKGIIAARDKRGVTPLVIGEKDSAYAVSFETSAFPNLGFKTKRILGPGEIGLINQNGYKQLQEPGNEMNLCAFLYIYYSFPGSNVEGINVERARYECGAMLAERDIADGIEIDFVAGIPDSGTPHAIGYSNRSGKPYMRPFVKYATTWQRSFMPQSQDDRDRIAIMKLIPIPEMIEGKRILFCEDSIVRGTQLKKTIERLWSYNPREIHMRPACPPLTARCKYLNFSRSNKDMELSARRAIEFIEGRTDADIIPYLDENSVQYTRMVERIGKDLKLTSLRFQRREDMIKAIGLPAEKLCLGCWR